MGKSAKNGTTLVNAILEYRENLLKVVLRNYIDMGSEIISSALEKRKFLSFTGNTITSYMVGIYFKGRLDTVIRADSQLMRPLRLKVKRGEKAWLYYPYEGTMRSVIGRVDVDSDFGSETSLKFLKSFQVDGDKYPLALVATTGTEYSSYLEDVRNLNVLTDTYLEMTKILSNNIKAVN